MHNMKFRMVDGLRQELNRLGFDVDYWHNYDFVFVWFDTMSIGFSNDPDAFSLSSITTETTLEQLKNIKA